MLKNLEDVKLFIEWCKEHKVKSFKIDGVQFELSELAFVENIQDGWQIKIIYTKSCLPM